VPLFMSHQRSIESQHRALVRRRGKLAARCGALVAAVLGAHDVNAQASASATLASENSYRGVSLSRGRPAPQLRIDYDSGSGWYAGAFASRVSLADSDANAQLVVYGGYAQRLSSGLAWEAGALDTSFLPGQQYRYHEFYVGLARDRVGARLYFSPSYYGGDKTLYAEVNSSYPLRDKLVLTAHAGLLHPLGEPDEQARNRLDLRVGLGFELGGFKLQLSVLASAPRPRKPDAARAVALSASRAF
jgi:uncharacterized protein (TIGR02001 family)